MSGIDWLLDSDPAIRWQVLRDLGNASPEEVATERARVAHVHCDFEGGVGEPSRWNTLRALRVLDWWQA